jgi:hypothetical protein
MIGVKKGRQPDHHRAKVRRWYNWKKDVTAFRNFLQVVDSNNVIMEFVSAVFPMLIDLFYDAFVARIQQHFPVPRQ